MKKITFFLLFFISITFVSMTSNVFAGHNQLDLKIAKQNSQQVVAKGAKPQEKPNNPCMAKNACNPCSANPCAVKNACNPCAANPCAMKNPCGANPCAAKQPCSAKMKITPIRGTKIKSFAEAIAYGEKLWKNPKLGNSNLSCNTCHIGGLSFNKSFTKAYPHYVKMPDDIVNLTQMINFCMVNPMKAEPLAWHSVEMTALSAYVDKVMSKEFDDMLKANPCAFKNRAAKNPCAANPCAAKNPCATNPCAANPCAGR